MGKVVVVGGGWAGCAAAITAAKAGAAVVLIERTDLLLGTGLAGGYFRNNGRYTGAEEAKALGAGDLFECMDNTITNNNRDVEMPHHKHGAVYSVFEIEPLVRRVVQEYGVKILFEHRFKDVELEKGKIKAIQCANGETIAGDVFVDTTGTTGSQSNCIRHGNGCACCVLRCPTFGSRVSVAGKAGIKEGTVKRPDGKRGSFSGACEIPKETVAPELRRQLEAKSSLVIPLPKELVDYKKLEDKSCQQYSHHDYADNLVFLDNGYFKLISPFFAIEKLRSVPGFEKARYEDPYSGGRGNSIRYMAVSRRDNALRVEGVENLFCGGEKAGTYVGHSEAICTGSLAGHNAARFTKDMEPFMLPAEKTVLGGLIALANKKMQEEGDDLMERYTFAGGIIFEWMKEKDLYTTDTEKVKERIEKLGLTDFFSRPL